MESERDWQTADRNERWDMKDAGVALLRFTLLFGLCAVGLATLSATGKKDEWNAKAYDSIFVGSIAHEKR